MFRGIEGIIKAIKLINYDFVYKNVIKQTFAMQKNDFLFHGIEGFKAFKKTFNVLVLFFKKPIK